MTDPSNLLGLLDRWVTVTHPDAPHRVWHGRLTEVWQQPSIVLQLPGGGQQTLLADFHVEAAEAPAPAPASPHGEPRPFADLRQSGLLWLINRTAFHPHGLALALHFDDAGEAHGWSLITTDTGEPWQFDPATDDDGRRRAQATIATAFTQPPAETGDSQ